MIFSSIQFLFYFLPVLLLCVFVAPKQWRNYIILIGSLFFYTYGERQYIIVMLISITMNYFIGLAINQSQFHRKKWLILGIVGNLAMLVVFKYVNFFAENINSFLTFVSFISYSQDKSLLNYHSNIHLPIGISFFTFQAISYIIDIYRKKINPQTKFPDFALYISLFPQLIAGPIVRYCDIVGEIKERNVSIENFYCGCKRFMVGLSKKILIANYMAGVADHIFLLPPEEINTPLAWLGIICYSLQIYYDFSAYSDMAIGLGKMFGFDFLENFNYPYISHSIQDFWRRWHISLSSWFRDYLYIPLGGNRKGHLRTYFNLFIVFLLTGFWHGANWTFIVWGLLHGSFLIIERIGFKKVLEKTPKLLCHIYTLLVVMVAWVFFRSESLIYAIRFIKRMFWFTSSEVALQHWNTLMVTELYVMLISGIFFSMPIFHFVNVYIENRKTRKPYIYIGLLRFGLICCITACFLLSIIYLTAGTYNPFIYFRF